MGRAQLWSRSVLRSFGVVVAMGAVGCTNVDIHTPDVWDDWDADLPPAGRLDFAAQATFAMQFDGSGLGALSLIGVSGRVEVVSAEVPDVSIEGVRRVRSGSQLDADRSLENLDVEVSQRDATLHVTTRQPSRAMGRAYEVDYRILVPDGFHLFVELVAGEIDAAITLAAAGVVDFANVAGNIELEIPTSTSASLHADVVTGSIHLDNLDLNDRDPRSTVVHGTLGRGDGLITLSTVAGTVHVVGR